MAETEKKPRRILLYAVLYVCLLGACVFLACQIFVWLRPPLSDLPPEQASSPRQPREGLRTDFLGDPIAAGGLHAVAALPPVPPPPDAERIEALGRKDEGQGVVHLQWVFRVEMDPPAVEAHYRTVLAAAGYSFLSRKETSPRRSLLTFRKGETVVCVALRKRSRNAKIQSTVYVTQIRKERPDDFLPDFETEIPFGPIGVEE